MLRGPKPLIQFHYLSVPFLFTNRTGLKSFLIRMIGREGFSIACINYIFCTDGYLLKINQEYLGHNTYTDIISFQLSKPGELLLADIYISTERVRENAKNLKVSFREELHRVIFHGSLHLCGYKDKTPNDINKMRQKENEWLQKYLFHKKQFH
ncbi:MAG: rRNA maturation RNase YbeY [Flavisolibacter sp.]